MTEPERQPATEAEPQPRIESLPVSKTQAGPPSNSGPQLLSDGKLFGISVAVIGILGDLLLGAILAGDHAVRGPPPFLLTTGAVAWVTSGVGLLAVWLGLGGGPLYFRLAVAAIPGALLMLIFRRGNWNDQIFAAFALFEVAVASPFLLLRICGVEMISPNLAKQQLAGQRHLAANQFSLRQMFGWTVAVALVASVARLADLPAREWLSWTIPPTLFSLVAVAAAASALMPKSDLIANLLVAPLCIVTPLVPIGLILAFAPHPPSRDEDYEVLGYFATAAVFHVLLMWGVLRMYRGLGYRLRRRGNGQTVSNTLVAEPASADPLADNR